MLIATYCSWDMYKRAKVSKQWAAFSACSVRTCARRPLLGTGYVQSSQGEQAMNGFERIHHDNLPLNALIYACILRASVPNSHGLDVSCLLSHASYCINIFHENISWPIAFIQLYCLFEGPSPHNPWLLPCYVP